MRRTLVVSVTLLLIASLGGCGGWSLRGTRGSSVESVYIRAEGAQRLRYALRYELNNSGVRVVRRQSDASAVIEVSDESFDRRVLSVDPDTGKVREVELGLEARFLIRDKEGKVVMAPEKMSWVQDFVFDENSLLGTNERANLIEKELAEDAAQSIRLRLETLEIKAR